MNMKPIRATPPQLAQRFLRWFLRDELAEEVEGDLEEKFYQTLEEHSLDRAKRNYWYQVFHYLRPFATRNLATFYNPTHYAMYKSYFKIGWRTLKKQKGYSFLNIGGLALGMAVAMLIGLWIWDELSFNQYHENYERIAAVAQNQTYEGVVETGFSNSVQLGPVLRENYGSNFKHVVMSSFTQSPILSYKEKSITKTGCFMEADAPQLLTLKMLQGTHNDLQDLYSILLSESTAYALFGNIDPLGEIIKIDNQLDVKVTGIYKDIPDNSSFNDVRFIAPLELLVRSGDRTLSWTNNWLEVLVELEDNVDVRTASLAIRDAKLNNVGPNLAKFNPELFLHPLPRWRLYSDFKDGVPTGGGYIEIVWLFGIIGVFVILLACINFMNLSTARSEKRAKEVGIRKVVGSLRRQLVSQFFSESLLMVLLAFLMLVLLVQLALPWFNELADKEISSIWTKPGLWLFGLVIIVFTTLISGSYPALYLSTFRPIKVLRGTFRASRFAAIPRKALVVVQFTVSITLIIGTIMVYQQIQFAKNRPLGYSQNGLLFIPMKTNEVKKHYKTFRNRLLATGTVSAVAKSETRVTDMWWSDYGFEWPGKDPDMQDNIYRGAVDYEFGQTVGWTIKEGRDFSREFASDSLAMILNEAAVTYMGLEHPIGVTVRAYGRDYTIIGVVENMLSQSMYEPVQQTYYVIDPFNRAEFINVKISPQASANEAIEAAEAAFKDLYPFTPFEYTFADELLANKYAFEVRIGTLAGIFATLAIIISCLGLFGLAAFVAEQRTKEIGIRKVLGASVASLWQLLSRDFIGLVVLSCLIAIPLAYYFAHDWLQNYNYRTDLHWWVFAVAAGGALVITIATVSFQTIKASTVNPVNSLRSE